MTSSTGIKNLEKPLHREQHTRHGQIGKKKYKINTSHDTGETSLTSQVTIGQS